MPKTATTADAMLYRIRDAITALRLANAILPPAVLLLTELVEQLDNTLTNASSALPLDWSDACRSLVLNGLPTAPRWAGFADVSGGLPDDEPFIEPDLPSVG